nr:HNH endonuclease signature motif containing protein [Arthrobacter sp. BF1]
MDMANWSGSSEDSNLSGPSDSGFNLEEPIESNSAASFEAAKESPTAALHSKPSGTQPARCSEPFSGTEPFSGQDAAASPLEECWANLKASRLGAGSEWILRNVLRFAEPLILPRPITVPVYGGTKRVQRLLPTLTAEEQENYVAWTPQLGAAALAELDPEDLNDEDVLNYIQASERQASWAMARQAKAINVFATRRPPVLGEDPPVKHPDRSRYATAEIMAMFGIGTGAAEHLITDAELLVQHLPDTFAQFSDGSLDQRRVRAVIRGCENTPPQILHEIENKFLNSAMSCNPNALTRKVRGIAERHNPEPIEQRHQRARTNRDVWITPLPDGMACLGARLPATEATLLFNSLEDWAKAAKTNGEDSHGTTPTGRPSRSLAEYRADVLMDLLHQVLLHSSSGSEAKESAAAPPLPGQPCGPYFKKRIPAVLNITVSADRLLGASNDPATLDGYGLIPLDDAKELAATAKFWRRFLTDPDSGRIVSVGRKTRKPPRAMAREVRLRDPVCTGIGCDRPARSCELDHTAPYSRFVYSSDGVVRPLGETSLENLRPRCPYCHHVKDDPHTGWTVENVGPGVTRTVTPTGRVYLQTQGHMAAPF